MPNKLTGFFRSKVQKEESRPEKISEVVTDSAASSAFASGPPGMELDLSEASLDSMQDYITSVMEDAAVPDATIFRMNTAADEIYSNIMWYSQATQARVSCNVDGDEVCVVLEDDGIPYNPLDQEDPDLSAEKIMESQRGLGIFLMRKLLDDVSYTRAQNRNYMKMILYINRI